MARLNLSDNLASIIADLLGRVARLETGQRSGVAVLAADPTNPRDGDIWTRTSDNTLRVRINGVTKTITIT